MVLMLFNLRDLSLQRKKTKLLHILFGFPSLVGLNFFIFLQYTICKTIFRYKTTDEITILKYISYKIERDPTGLVKHDSLRDLLNSFNGQHQILTLQDQVLFIRAWLEAKSYTQFQQVSYTDSLAGLLESSKFVLLQEIGVTLYNENYVAFIAITIILLIVLVGGVAIVLNRSRNFFLNKNL
jgi:hypothetical protein